MTRCYGKCAAIATRFQMGCDARSGARRLIHLLLIEEADGFHGKTDRFGGGSSRGLSFLGADFFQFALVEPVAAAVGTLIDFDQFCGAVIMTTQFNAVAARAFAFALMVHDDF